jgi:hypothetical protein
MRSTSASDRRTDAEGRFRLKAREGESLDLSFYSEGERGRMQERVRSEGVPAGSRDLVLRP